MTSPSKRLAVLDQRHRPMIIAVVAMRVMQSTISDVIDVISVRHHLMSAAGAVHGAVFLSSMSSTWAAARE